MKASLAAALIGLLAGTAQGGIPAPFADRLPEQLARDAFDSAYGQLLVAEFGRILRLSAEPGCLKSKGLALIDLQVQARDVLVRNGAQLLGIGWDLIDGAKLEAALAQRAGASAKADFARLREDPDVRRYVELAEPAKLARVADNIAETIDRHALLSRLGLRARLAPISTGNDALLSANPEETSLEEAERFFQSRDSGALRRWRELEEALQQALLESQDRETLLRLGPRQMTPGLPADLEGVCVLPR